jgi:hypothetical protein
MRSNLCILFALCCLASHASDPATAVKAPNPEASKPVTAALGIVPEKIVAGKTATLLIKVRILALHHIYALNKSGSENTPTSFQLQLPKGMKLNANWKAPEPKKGKGKSRIYEEEVIFEAPVLVGEKVSAGKHTIKCEMAYQVCDEELCWPPAKLNLAAEIEVLPSN